MPEDDPSSTSIGPEGSAAHRPPTGWTALAFSTDSVYGLIIVAGMLVVSTSLSVSSGEALLSVATTLLVFFAAHVYASAMSHLALEETRGSLREALAHGVRESAGLLVAGVIPLVMLVLGLFGIVQDADALWLALGVDMLLLGVLGWFIAAARTTNTWIRISSVLVMGLLGGILVLLKAAVHH